MKDGMTRMHVVIGLVAMSLAAAPPAAAQPPVSPVPAATAKGQPSPSATGPYLLTVGDVLDIMVWRNKELTMSVTIRPDGFIAFPVAGEIRAAGLTPADLQRQLEKALAESIVAPAVTVLVTRVSGFKVSVLGKVRQPGRFDVQDQASVIDLLAQAGGPNEYADVEGMYVLRRTDPQSASYVRIPVRFSAAVTPGKDTPNLLVRPGDVIVVP
jgi:polysaccharide biosynthesis/export protein